MKSKFLSHVVKFFVGAVVIVVSYFVTSGLINSISRMRSIQNYYGWNAILSFLFLVVSILAFPLFSWGIGLLVFNKNTQKLIHKTSPSDESETTKKILHS